MKFGVLGYGKIVREEIAPAIHEAGHRIVAVGSRSGKRPAGYAGRLHTSYSQCIEDPDVEAIYIATPNHLHVPLACQALRAGKPVLCEKPIAMSYSEFQTLAEVQAATGVALQEAFMVNYHPQWSRLKSLELGDHRLLRTSFTYTPRQASDVRSRPELGGGVWLDIGCYGLWSCYQLGARQLRSVSGEWRASGEVVDHVQTTLSFDALDAQIEVGGLHFRQQSLSLVTDRLRLSMPRPFNPLGTTEIHIETESGCEVMHDQANQYARMITSFVSQCQQGEFIERDCSEAIARWSDTIERQLT